MDNHPNKRYLLAIDNGTQSVRALLFDLQGNLLGKGKVELQAYYSTQPGWAEQDPEYYWAKLGRPVSSYGSKPALTVHRLPACP